MAQHWATIKEAGAVSGMRFMAWIYRSLGRNAFNVVLAPVMIYYLLRRPLARKASKDFLRRVKEEYPDSLPGNPTVFTTFIHFFRFGQSLLDKFVAWIEPPSDIQMNDEERELLYDLIESKKGCLLIGSHFGNLEYSRGIAYRHPGLVVNILLHDKHARNFATLLADAAPESRMNLLQVTDLDLDLAFQLKHRIEQGEWLLIAGDRIPVGEGDNVCEADFLGDSASFPIGPYVLGSLLRCPVYLLHCYRVGGEYRLGIEPFAAEIRPDRIDHRRTYHKEVQQFASALEKQVSKAPLQWFNFFDFWARPQGKIENNQGHADAKV